MSSRVEVVKPCLRAALIMLTVMAAWQGMWLLAGLTATGGKEFADDVPSYLAYVHDPTILLSERHRSVFGAAVAAPLLPFELKAFHFVFQGAGEFVALRLTMMVHLLAAGAIGFAAAFRCWGAPTQFREWITAVVISLVPVAWITSVLTAQDDCVAAAWAGVILAACMLNRPVWAAIATGLGVFSAKILLLLAFPALWIAYPGRRWAITGVACGTASLLLLLLVWRDGGIAEYASYYYAPYMGANPYSLFWLTVRPFDIPTARNLSTLLTGLMLLIVAYFGVRRRLSVVGAVVSIHMLFLTTYFGAMPEYYAWFLPFLFVALWCCGVKKMWGTLVLGCLTTFFAYGYKVVYGMNSRFPGGKAALKSWAAENVPLSLDSLQIAMAAATVVSTLLFGVCVLWIDPTGKDELAGPA